MKPWLVSRSESVFGAARVMSTILPGCICDCDAVAPFHKYFISRLNLISLKGGYEMSKRSEGLEPAARERGS